MTILVTGASGLLGAALQRSAPATARLLLTAHPDDCTQPHMLPLDITDARAARTLVERMQPTVIIHAAAASSVDWCEEHPDKARAINTDAAIHFSRLAQASGARFIFISSNAVYGSGARHREDEPTAPVNEYGRTKADAETNIQAINPSGIIIRPNLMFGFPPPGGRDNQVSRVLNALSAHQTINVVNDTYFSPIASDIVALMIWQLIPQQLTGIINIGSAERMTLYELSRLTARVFGLDEKLLEPISHRNTSAPAPRAIDTSYDISRLQSLVGTIPSINGQLALLERQLSDVGA
ncbi:MAG: hypothetical protein COT71_01755 [Candidatus Andersenbacteria bacterium CG10_big_fil_rev_8_21_14_0_10_54_11]|uniref:dTDP-4-dehydrorhamnose reductase n=1 Tax=Candidatus Andersenbacteria bacterium CG10_big_fil_rev_8_21_14_0_10_54_11 TaxID=1974485 RepID=A0A2M6WZN7_9BACT|nr:MAG: hypothetical protein COT71_01755 [Candidatus Andersenbacteria bacterium CG10_big_fil_rev_8_21_14_0_10_54_11]